MAASFTKDIGTEGLQVFREITGFDVVIGTLNLGASYTTGGEAVTASLFDTTGKNSTLEALFVTDSEDAVIYYRFDSANSKVIAYDAAGATAAEEAAATDLSATAKSCECIAIVSA